MGTNEKLLVLYPTKDGIIVKTLFYHDEIAAMPKRKLDENELSMAKMLIENMTRPKLMREYKKMSLIRVNMGEAVVPESLGERAVGINADLAKSVEDMLREVTEDGTE